MRNSRGNSKLQMAVRIALAGSAVAALGVASAQTEVEEIVVTGSRIALAPNEVSISPVVAITPLELESTGATRIEDVLNQLPQVFASQGATISNGSDGTANVDLRGLQAKRTVVLINGRRLGPGDPLAAPDLNQIPLVMVDRVEVLTGGAASTYGADAVAGVVNFILNDHFEGIKFVSSYSTNTHDNDNPQGVADDLKYWNDTYGTSFEPAPSTNSTGETKDLALMMGFNAPDGRGNVTAYATYRDVKGVLQDQFDYSAVSLGSGYNFDSQAPANHFGVAGSSSAVPGRFRQVSATGVNIGGSRTIDATTGDLRNFGNADRYNFGPLNYYQRPDQRWTAGALAHYEFNEHADVYTEIQYVNDRTVSQIAPSGAFYGTGPYKVNCANPYFNQSMLNEWCGGSAAGGDIFLLVGRRNVEGNPRRDDLEHSSLRFVAGTKGSMNSAWDYDFYGQLAINQLSEDYQNDVSISRVRNALDVVDDGAGNPVCRSVVNGVDPTCVPWNIWQPQLGNNITDDALNYIRVPLVQRGEVQQKILHFDTTGDLGAYGWKLPSASTGVKINTGVSWSELESSLVPDLTYQTGDAAGQGSPTPVVQGTVRAKEVFLEARVPLIDGKPGADSLAFETGYRYSDYSLGFNTDTYKFGLEWAPIQDIRLRGSYTQAVRAPNAQELFQPRFVGLDGSSDFCAGAAPAFTAAQCAAQGVSAAQYGFIDPNPAAQYYGYIGGDRTLQPETATTKSFGIGWTPSFLAGFRVNVDYFDIDIKDTIQRVGFETTQQLCSNQGEFCNRIRRDVNGSLWITSNPNVGNIDDPLGNQGALRTSGFDVDMSYAWEMGRYGSMQVGLVGTKLETYEITPLQTKPETEFDCAGFFGNNCNANVNAPLYEWRHTLRTTWSTPWRGLDIGLAWRHLDSVTVDLLSPNVNLNGGNDPATAVEDGLVSSTDAKIRAIDYIDLTASIMVNEKISFRVGFNNLLDESPPVIGSNNCAGCNGNVYSQTYDTLGRYMFGTLTVEF
jgi:outer membrane receptor protein involved in Fe transport